MEIIKYKIDLVDLNTRDDKKITRRVIAKHCNETPSEMEWLLGQRKVTFLAKD